jgi:hypothetical protein
MRVKEITAREKIAEIERKERGRGCDLLGLDPDNSMSIG